MGDRQLVVPASGFPISAQQICNIIKVSNCRKFLAHTVVCETKVSFFPFTSECDFIPVTSGTDLVPL